MATNASDTTEKFNKTRNFESFSCVWLDENINETDDNRQTEQKLRQIINYLFTCTDPTECEQYITNITQEKIVLIASGKLSQDFLPCVHDLPQLSACYIFCGRISFHRQWSKDYSKVKGVFNNIDQLIEKFSQDQIDRNKFEESASISVINHSSQSVEEHNAIHMWFLLYIEVLLRMHHKLSDRKELVDLCRRVCQGNSSQLEILDEFETTYESTHAIWWYTRETCLYRILNKALRFQDYSTLFAFRFFISDIAKQINIHYEKYLRTNGTRSTFVVYRGQAIHSHELEMFRKNIGEYLSMNSFFSTSLKESIASKFIRSLPDDDRYEKILFQIQIDPTFQSKSFAR